ncbi:hypothetical protein IPG41_01990 [Candidatus Peregrinibacteria bacterium]|nr:MAG: hypothetical protein IPG41_01990 [Candidatus Peregrinibacteria bacterium]
MLFSGEFIPEDKIDPRPIAEGTRVRVHRLQGHDGLNGRILRVPRDPERDHHETVQMELLKGGPLTSFLPDPETVRARIGDRVRNLVTSLEVTSSLHRVVPSAESFAYELQAKGDIDAQIHYLQQLRGFVDACKNTYKQSCILPDLIGRGNVVSDSNGIWLLDFNNISGQWTVGPEIQVPLDDQGLPIFDMGLQLLHSIEKKLLTQRGTNLSTEAFNRKYSQERRPQRTELPKELLETLVSADDLKKDPFYGALRFRKRRQKVQSILDKMMRDRMVH